MKVKNLSSELEFYTDLWLVKRKTPMSDKEYCFTCKATWKSEGDIKMTFVSLSNITKNWFSITYSDDIEYVRDHFEYVDNIKIDKNSTDEKILENLLKYTQ